MTRIPMEELSDSAHVWIFGAAQGLDRSALDSVFHFIDGWKSHDAPVLAAADLLHDRFLVVAADESMNPSGCSIDKLFRRVGELEREAGIRLLDSSLVFVQSAEGVGAVSRAEFKKTATPETIVFDPTIETLGD
ncbi:MAG TPA: hypothetical protein VIL97_01895, partial [Thermoanaerobaculia bacterium]